MLAAATPNRLASQQTRAHPVHPSPVHAPGSGQLRTTILASIGVAISETTSRRRDQRCRVTPRSHMTTPTPPSPTAALACARGCGEPCHMCPLIERSCRGPRRLEFHNEQDECGGGWHAVGNPSTGDERVRMPPPPLFAAIWEKRSWRESTEG